MAKRVQDQHRMLLYTCTVTGLVGIVPSSPLGFPLASPSPWFGCWDISRLDCVQDPASSTPDIAMDGITWRSHITSISFIAVGTSEGMGLIELKIFLYMVVIIPWILFVVQIWI